MKNLLENLNKEQMQGVKHGQGPLLIVAGAGTGKTTVITRRIAYLIEQKLAKPDEILALTFTEKAASEMQERVDILLPLGYYDQWISTFHSFCERILKAHALDIGISNDFKLLDSVQQWILLYQNLDKFDLDYYRPMGNPNRFIDSLLKHFSRCKDEMITPEDYLKYAEQLRLSAESREKVLVTAVAASEKQSVTPGAKTSKSRRPKPLPLQENPVIDPAEISRIQELANAYKTYQKLLFDNGVLDFGDLINCTLELFKKRPKILQYYQKHFRFIMVDEFQDTNYAQYQLVNLLAGTDKNLVVVGDDDQSIYKFRGASVSNIMHFKEDYPASQQITLIENYRSTQNILDLAYNFIQANNPDRLEQKLHIDKRLRSNSSEEGKIEVCEASDLSNELHFVAKKITDLKNADPNCSWNGFAVLLRANSAADQLLPILSLKDIPYTFVASKGLYKKPIILDILAYMRLLDNAHDSTALYRVLTLPKFRLPHNELSELLLYSKQKTTSLYQTLEPAQALETISPEGKKKLAMLKEFLHKHAAEAKSYTAAEMMAKIVNDLNIERRLEEDTSGNSDSRELLDQFYKKIEEFEKQNSHRDLHSFLSYLLLEMQAGDEGSLKFDPNLGPESVKVMTIHAAKGLEFQYVFIINMVDQRFPTREKSDAIEIPEALIKDILPEGNFHLQEERRLFYVAITRARQQLYLTWAKDYGGTRSKKPSQFLLETELVPSDKVSSATGKVIFSNPSTDKTKVLSELKLPKNFSFSDIASFQNCPLEYKYARLLKLPLWGNHYKSFGNTIHGSFEDFLRQYQRNQKLNQTDLFGYTPSESPLPEFKILENCYDKNWVDDWYESPRQKEQYKKLGLSMLKYFYDDISIKKPEVKYIEQFFKLNLGKYEFVGKIDRADQTAAGLEIIDYKTGKKPKTKKDIDQLYVYQMAAQEFLGEKVAVLKYWYLQDGLQGFVEESVANHEEIEKLKDELLQEIEKIVEVIKSDSFKEADNKAPAHDCRFESLE